MALSQDRDQVQKRRASNAFQNTIKCCPACGSPVRLAAGEAPISVLPHEHQEQALHSDQPAGAPDRRRTCHRSRRCPRAFRPRRRRSRDGGRRAPTLAGPATRGPQRRRPRRPDAGSDVVGGNGLEEVLEAVRAVPGMGSAVGSDRCLGRCLHVERPEETRQRAGRMGAAADRAVVQRAPTSSQSSAWEAPVRRAAPGPGTGSGRREASTGSHRRSLSWNSGVTSMRCMRTTSSSPRRHIGLPQPPATSRMVSPARY
jgi:hypothetical protein